MTPLKPFGPTPFYYNKWEVPFMEGNKRTKRKGEKKSDGG